MHIAIIGTGYVGLVSGACLAAFGHRVTCIDQEVSKISRLAQGQIPFHEPGLAELVQEQRGINLEFSFSLAPGVAIADVVIMAVGTPPKGNGDADTSQLFTAIDEVARHLKPGAALVIKSTVPVGTARRIQQRVIELRGSTPIHIISNPEFLREGSAIADFMSPDRIVVGFINDGAQVITAAVYAPLLAAGVPLVAMTNEAAELCKYASNVFLAMRVAYVNELADLCEAMGADIGDVVRGMSLDHRIGPHHFQPGPGFGGSCFSKDIAALQYGAQQVGLAFRLGRAIEQSNALRKQSLVVRVARAIGGNVTGKSIALLGLAFKANTDDLRDSPALQLIADLNARGACVRAYDPALKFLQMPGVALCENLHDAVEDADAAVIMTEWDEFRCIELHALAREMRKPVLIDFRNLFPTAEARAAGLTYHSLGRARVGQSPVSQFSGLPSLEPFGRSLPA